MFQIMNFIFLSSFASAFVSLASADQIDALLRKQISLHELDRPFIADLEVRSDQQDLVELGGDLFYSPDLSVDGSVSCASCHHPSMGGADGVALPVGIGGGDSRNVGENRIQAAKDNSSAKIAAKIEEGLIPRNSPTVFNSSLYQHALFWDGRVQYVETADGTKMIRTGFGISDYNPTKYDQKTLLQAQSRMPLTSVFEMKGWLEPHKNNVEIELGIVEFLRASEYWCKRFTSVFGIKECESAISLSNITSALAVYQASLVYTNSAFERYVQGDLNSLSAEQKEGALLFLLPIDQGGLGCSSCHSGKNLSDEKFYNLSIPASGRGVNEFGWDFGRRNVDPSTGDFSFRTPSLLNIAATAPYMHNGVATTLEDAVLFHLNDGNIPQSDTAIQLPGWDYKEINSAIAGGFKATDKAILDLLPNSVNKKQLQRIVQFLYSLSDDCVSDPSCMSQLVREPVTTPRKPKDKSGHDYPNLARRQLEIVASNPPDIECAKGKEDVSPPGEFTFSIHHRTLGLNHIREIGLIRKGWLLDIVNLGGLSAMDVNYDCLDDLVFDAGAQGLIFYLQSPNGGFEEVSLKHTPLTGANTPLTLDVDGDYKFDLFVGSSGQSPAYLVYDFLGRNELFHLNQLTGPVINASAADIDLDGDIDLALAFWRSFKSLHQDHIWLSDGEGNLDPRGGGLVLRESNEDITDTENSFIWGRDETPFSESDMTFTPNFADIDGDGDQDLLLAADFLRSQVLRNEDGFFEDITDKSVITDNNGMGAAIGDFDNDHSLGWFVTSIYRGKRSPETGNHLYISRNGEDFSRAERFSPASDNEWSWGACAEDFDNDGFLDIFYVSGFGEPLSTDHYEDEEQKLSSEIYWRDYSNFSRSTPRLLLNDREGSFRDVSAETGFSESYGGRGVACFDYEQDGDIDIVINPIDGAPRLYRNELNGSKNWMAIRLIGLPGNTEAFGAKVTLETENGTQFREVRFENNYLSRNPGQIHFGLDDMEHVSRILIEFPRPHQKLIVMSEPEINQLHLVRQSSAQ